MLGTSGPTFVDFHFCSMAAILLLPSEYGGSALDSKTKVRIAKCQKNKHSKDIKLHKLAYFLDLFMTSGNPGEDWNTRIGPGDEIADSGV